MRRSASALTLAVLLLGGTTSTLAAQSHQRPLGSQRVDSVHLDLATGTYTRGPAVSQRSATTVVDFSNSALGGFVGTDSGGGACEWITAGTKGLGNSSDLMSGITFGYCSAALDTAFGGPGGSAVLGFYEGYTHGDMTPSTLVAQFSLTGLPANTGSSSANGAFQCYFISVDFDPLVCFADGPIGYSWNFADVGTDGVLAATFPFLTCVNSCTGPGPSGPGMVYEVDRFCPPGTLLAPLPTFAAVSMQIREVADTTATVASFVGDGLNADSLSATTIRLGQPWDVGLTIGHAHGAGGPMALRVRTGTINGANVTSPIGGRLTELLVQGPLLAALSSSHNGVSGSFPTVDVPKVIDLLCASWAAQATVLGGGFADLSLAVTGVVGTE